MKMMYLMQGIPGSGKSFMAALICQSYVTWGDRCPIFSTDNYWYQRFGEDKSGVYLFEKDLLPEAHDWNQGRARLAMIGGVSALIIDNTNIRRSAAVPYLEMATEFAYSPVVIRVSCPVELAIERNLKRPTDRQVPEELIRQWNEEMEDLL